MYDDRTNLTRQVAADLREFFADEVFRTIVPRSVRLAEAPSFGKPILAYDPRSKGAESYIRLAKEILDHEQNREPRAKRSVGAWAPCCPPGRLTSLRLQPRQPRKRPSAFPSIASTRTRSSPGACFRAERLSELAQSIRANGIIQPLVVRRSGERYQLVAGERRWRAAKLAGSQSVPGCDSRYSR